MFRSGIPSCILHALGIPPIGMYAVFAVLHYDSIKGYTEIEGPPYNSRTIKSQGVAAISATIALAWNLVIWYPSRKAARETVFSIGVLDAAFGVVFLIAWTSMAKFIPFSLACCAEADSWQVPSDVPSFFKVIADHSLEKASHDVCLEHTGLLDATVAAFAFYMILAVVNILTSCCISGRRQRPPLAYSRRSLMGPLNFGGWMFAHIPPCFFAWTYTWKRLSSLRDQYELQPLVTTGPRNLSTGLRKFSARLHKPMPETRSLITGEPSQTPLLLQALWRYEVLTSIASHLHYVDIINLGRTSRDIRSVIFSDGRRPSDSLVLLTCRGSREQECWFCGRKVCLACRETRECGDSSSTAHLRHCKAHCSKCYYSQICRSVRSTRPCSCNRDDSGQPPNSPLIGRPAHHPQQRPTCDLCFRLPVEDVVSVRGYRDRDVLIRVARQTKSCSNCECLLPCEGPRWWICMLCQRQCFSDHHPHWAPKGSC